MVWKILGGAVAVLVVLFLVGTAMRTPEGDLALEAKHAVAAQLRDSASAEFRNVKVYRSEKGTLTACGEVNGRNGFGSMTGYNRFVYIGGGAFIDEPTSDSTFETAWSTANCDGTAMLAQSLAD